MEKEREKEKNLIVMVKYYLKVNISKEKDGMEKEKNIIMMIIFLKVNLLMDLKMANVKNIILVY